MDKHELDLDALWRTIYGEAEPDDELDAVAIGWVVLNRVKWDNWPKTIRGVCYQKWQFSCWNADNPRLDHLNSVEPDASTWTARCYAVAESLMSSDPPPDPTNGATHYYATYISPPKWARGKTPTLKTDAGRYTHLFFNDIDTPPPQSPAESLEQSRPLKETRTVKAGRAGGAVGGVAVVSGAVAAAGPAVPVLRDVADMLQDNAGGVMIVFGVAVLVTVGLMIYARLDDRRRGLR